MPEIDAVCQQAHAVLCLYVLDGVVGGEGRGDGRHLCASRSSSSWSRPPVTVLMDRTLVPTRSVTFAHSYSATNGPAFQRRMGRSRRPRIWARKIQAPSAITAGQAIQPTTSAMNLPAHVLTIVGAGEGDAFGDGGARLSQRFQVERVCSRARPSASAPSPRVVQGGSCHIELGASRSASQRWTDGRLMRPPVLPGRNRHARRLACGVRWVVVRRDEPPELWGNGDDAAPGAVEAAAVGRDRVVVELAQVARTVQDGCERDQGRVLGTGRLVSQRSCARDCGAELVRSASPKLHSRRNRPRKSRWRCHRG
jgi:hypothetical protein